MAVPRDGRYVVKTDLTGFASVTQEVVVNASSQNGGSPTETAEFKVDLASRVTPEPTHRHLGRQLDSNSPRRRTGRACRWRPPPPALSPGWDEARRRWRSRAVTNRT